ncbi:unnamed protein product [Parnassius apollo]|uniref:(apollo) hypothetical protein n=1 Tax=Parnassius apollo TaxID=110799 RepID=A0A8S3W0Q1_PARAO|nr:unnamed protein product [Parnassius apollo]
MAKVDSAGRGNSECLNVDFMRSLVQQYSELGQWTSAFFWADAAAAAGNNTASGDDIWLLASAMLARGELHRAGHAVTSRGLHRRHLLCLGVALRAYIAAKEPATALSLIEECDTQLLEPRSHDQTHNRALAGVLVWQARALAALERREAAAEALTTALRADSACYEALDLLLEQHALTPRQETDLIESLPINSQLSAAEAAFLRAAYRDRLLRYAPLRSSLSSTNNTGGTDTGGNVTGSQGVLSSVEAALSRSLEGAARKARRLAAAGHWAEALKELDLAGPWACADIRAACLVELRKSAELFAFAHALVDAYPQSWTSWFAVGCYYYLIGKSDFARRYLSKAKSLEPGAGCIWLAYGHSFAADKEHDQAMAAYFKATQLMAGCHLPPLYVGVESSLLNNVSMCERFLLRAATLHNDAESAGEQIADETDVENVSGWDRIARVVCDPHVAHEAGAAAYAAGEHEAARALWLRALDAARDERDQVPTRARGGARAVAAGAGRRAKRTRPGTDTSTRRRARCGCRCWMPRGTNAIRYRHEHEEARALWLQVLDAARNERDQVPTRARGGARAVAAGAGRRAGRTRSGTDTSTRRRARCGCRCWTPREMNATRYRHEHEAERALWLQVLDAARNERDQVPTRARGGARAVAVDAGRHAGRARPGTDTSTRRRARSGCRCWTPRGTNATRYRHEHEEARALWLLALDAMRDERDQLHPRWAATLDGLGHVSRALGEPRAALRWHERALALRPARAASLTARGLCLALLGRARAAADALHAALARDPDDAVALALLDAVVDRLDSAFTEEEIPQFPFPTVNLSLAAPSTPAQAVDATNNSDMSMSFD